MRIAVFGAGAMGSFVGACLSRNADVTIIARPPHVDAVRRHGLRVEGLTRGTFRVAATTRAAGARDSDLVVLTTKAHDTPGAAQAMRREGVDAPVLSLQNGLTNLATLAKALPGNRLLGGTTTHGVTFVRPGLVRHAGKGDLVVGTARGPPSLARTVARHLSTSGLACATTGNLHALLWRKAVLNAAINPVSAMLRVANGHVLGAVESRLIARMAAGEAAAVAGAEGVRVHHPWAEVRRVLVATASNRSSMLQDLESGRPTEIDSITGEIVRVARTHGIEVPVNRGLLRAVRSH